MSDLEAGLLKRCPMCGAEFDSKLLVCPSCGLEPQPNNNAGHGSLAWIALFLLLVPIMAIVMWQNSAMALIGAILFVLFMAFFAGKLILLGILGRRFAWQRLSSITAGAAAKQIFLFLILPIVIGVAVLIFSVTLCTVAFMG